MDACEPDRPKAAAPAAVARHVAGIAWSLVDAATPGPTLRLADAAVEALVGRAYITILRLEAGSTSRRIFSTVPDVYAVGDLKPLGPSAWRDQVVAGGRVFVAATPAEIAAHFPDPGVVAGLGGRCLVNVPVPGRDGATIGLFNVASAHSYDEAAIGLLGTIGGLLGPAIGRVQPPSPQT